MSDSPKEVSSGIVPVHVHSSKIMDVAKHVETVDIDQSTRLEVFTFIVNSNEFDYDRVAGALLNSVYEFALSRKTIKNHISNSDFMKLSYDAVQKFINYRKPRNGELGEFLLFCFLEGHLGAPKILSKLELKTSPDMPVFKSDGVHYLDLGDGGFQLIFGESKLYKDLTEGLHEAFKSIAGIKKVASDGRDGISYDKGLLSSYIDRETFSKVEMDFMEKIIYPSAVSDMPIVDDAFGIFLGYEIDISEWKKLKNRDFRSRLEGQVKTMIQDRKDKIVEYIEKYNLEGHSFYIYTVPFSKLDQSRKKIMGSLLGGRI